MSAKLTVEKVNIKKPPDSRLTAIGEAKTRYTPSGSPTGFVLCKCDCGNLKEIAATSVATGRSKSCGCIAKEAVINSNKNRADPNLIKAPQKKYPLRDCWRGMISRCYNPQNSMYKYYGGNGVTVCDEWRNDFIPFRDWALLNGWQKGLHLDKDIIGNSKYYSPSTCCFVTPELNNLMKPSIKRYEYNGEMLNMVQISKQTGISVAVLNSRYKFVGGTIQDAINHIKIWGATRQSMRKSILFSS